MTNESLFFYGAWILPPIIIFFTAYTKNIKLFLVGVLVSIFVSYSFYANSFNIESISEEEMRHFLVVDLSLIGGILMVSYSIIISIIFWNIQLIKVDNKKSFKEFMKQSSFYFILFFGTVIDIGLSSFNEYIYWKPLFFSFFLLIPFLIKALLLKYSTPKKKNTSKVTWILLAFIIVFYLYNFFLSRI